MSYQHRELRLTFEPGRGWANFVLYTEPDNGVACAGLNGTVILERQTPFVREWFSRLQRCEPTALHTTLVDNRKIPLLFHPCVDEDKTSPSAVAGAGCVCFRTFNDPEFGLPVVGDHYRTVDGSIDQWTYRTYAPLDLRPRDEFASLIIDEGAYFWIRTRDGLLALLPEDRLHGHTVGYGGAGPTQLAHYMQRLIDSCGQDTAAGRTDADIGQRLLAWTSDEEARNTWELDLADLRSIAGS